MKNYYTIFLLTLLYCFGSNIVHGQCIDNSNVWNKSWVSCQTQQSPNPPRGAGHWLLYEFDEPQSISESYVWNANRPAEVEFGIKDVVIDYSVDGANWIELGAFTFPIATGQESYIGFEGPGFGGIFIKKILLTVLDTYGDNTCASIAEIQFNIDPNACYGTIDVCGNCNGSGEQTWYLDADGDGFGSAETTQQSCTQPSGYVDNAEDYCDNGLLGWNKVGSIFSDNGCLGCHGNNALGGLDLSSFESASLGGNKCGPNILTGTALVDIITISNYAGCGTPIGFPSMNERVGGNIDSAELALLQSWIDAGAPEDCNCLAGAADVDNDGTCDAIDDCPGFDNALIGTACDDGNACTENDLWRNSCNCIGTPAADTDNDGVCDVLDASPENPCTADGTIDGNEPLAWSALPTNDCDGDLINNANGDILDFDACIDNLGQVASTFCSCENDYTLAGGYYEGNVGVGGLVAAASGVPDGIFSGYLGSGDNLTLSFPYLARGEQICVTVGFSDVDGIVRFDLNYNAFSYPNASGIANYEMQEFCFTTFQEGPQTVVISEIGDGGIRVDGSTYGYCDCSDSDPKAATPDCKCPDNTLTENGMYESSVGIGNASRSDGAPDGILTNGISGNDTLILNYPNIKPGGEICIIMGFNNPLGVASIELNGKLHYASNILKDSTYLIPQEFCFTNTEEGPQSIIIKDIGSGTIKVDGSVYKYCPDCVDVELSALLEGPFDSLTNKMTTTLNTFGLLPGQVPQNIIYPPTPAGQPYNTTPWNYAGTEGASWTNSDYSSDMVDWVLVSFRTGIDKSTEISQAAAILRESGRLYFPACPLFNQNLTELYVVIEHRSHIGIMTPTPVPILDGTLTYFFPQSDSYKDLASFGQKELPSGKWAMFAGDADQSDMPSYDIQGLDKDAWQQKNGIFSQYSNTDFDLNGDTNGADKALWFGNNGVSSRVPK